MIKEWIKLNTFKVMFIALVASIALNVFAFTWKGINITKEYHTHQHQEQFQGQLQFNMWMAQGDRVEWKIERVNGANAVVSKLNSLPPQYSYFTKITFEDNNIYTIFWPEFMRRK